MLRALFIGDIFGSPGRKCLRELLPSLRKELAPQLVVANGENAAGGLGITVRQAAEMFAWGVQVITTGNHVWQQAELRGLLENEPHLLRPANYPDSCPGRGYVVLSPLPGLKVAVVNLLGRALMGEAAWACPFQTLDLLLQNQLKGINVVFVDLHGEATSEKQALAWHFAGRVSAVVGTHTHVQTADERILLQKTAFITDLGMTGPHASVIGMEVAAAISRFLPGPHRPFKVAKQDLRLQGAVVECDEQGQALNIKRISQALAS